MERRAEPEVTMLCEKVVPLLSEFFDEVLDQDRAVQVSQHLGQCIGCRREFNNLSDLHTRLRSLNDVKAPEYLRSLVQHRLVKQPLRAQVRNELERYWSIIRTTEAMWYATRAMGTVIASVFFFLLPSAITPYISAQANGNQRSSSTPAYYCLGQQPEYRTNVSRSLTKKLGMAPAEMPSQPGRSAPAAINPLYLVEYGDHVFRTAAAGQDDTLSVAATVDSSGTATVETVLEHPSDKTLLTNFLWLLASARFRPASENGQSVRSYVVFTNSVVFVSD
jgi:hypothetical protein